MDVLGQQRPPADCRGRMLDGVREDVRAARAEILGKIPIEYGEVLLRRGGEDVGLLAPAIIPDADPEPVAGLRDLDGEERFGGGFAGVGHLGLGSGTESGCPARIRTSIDGVRVRSLTIRRRGTSHEPAECRAG